MIEINKDDVFNEAYIATHEKNVLNYIDNKGVVNIRFYNYSLKTNDQETKNLIRHIAFNPFSKFNSASVNHQNFLHDYNQISDFLLYSKKYFSIFKQLYSEKKYTISYRSYLLNERTRIVNLFKHNKILISMGINIQGNITSEEKYNKIYTKIKNSFAKENLSIVNLFNYNEFMEGTPNIRNEILSNMKISVCPYCNRQYIDTYIHEGKVRSIAHIDHFYPKSIYPLYALSLLNFVPACAHCNCLIKRDHLFPWRKIYSDNPDNSKYFNLHFTTSKGTLGDASDFQIKLTPKNIDDACNSIFFRHHDIYKNHVADISTILKKRRLYTDAYRVSIEQCMSSKISNDEFKEILFGVSSIKDHANSLLSKLKEDILDDILKS